MLDGGTAMALRLGHRSSIGFNSFSERTLHEAPVRKRLALLDDARLEQTEAKTCVERIAISGEKFGWPFRLRSAGNTKAKRRSGRLGGFFLDLPTTALKLILERGSQTRARYGRTIRRGMGACRWASRARALFGSHFSPAECLCACLLREWRLALFRCRCGHGADGG